MAIAPVRSAPGRPPGRMAVRSTLPSHPPEKVREVLRGLPMATGYRVPVKPLRYRPRPHLQAFTFWDRPEMLIQVPEPFRPFAEVVDLGALGRPLVQFRTRRDVIRFLYLHEFCHYWLFLVHGWGTAAEVACDRYAYAGYRRRGPVAPPIWRARGERAALERTA
ncbi:MAG: hypothetical protein AAB284_03395 [Chloroflexota bacterium]